jgi:hypothetical protein
VRNALAAARKESATAVSIRANAVKQEPEALGCGEPFRDTFPGRVGRAVADRLFCTGVIKRF